MSADGGSAFPLSSVYGGVESNGMSLRDYFAAAALPVLLADQLKNENQHEPIMVAVEEAYATADIMIMERDKKTEFGQK